MSRHKLIIPTLMTILLVLSGCAGGPPTSATMTAIASGQGGSTSTVVPTSDDSATPTSGEIEPTATLVPTSALTPTATLTGTIEPTKTGEKVNICHRTNSTGNPYNFLTIDAADVADHEAHGDLVLGVEDEEDCEGLIDVEPTATITSTPTISGTVTPTVVGTPGTGNQKVSICHRTGSAKKPYVFITVAEAAVPAHEAHGDIIGVSSRADCPTSDDDAKDKDKDKDGDDDAKDKDKDKPKPTKAPRPNNGGNGGGGGGGKKK